MSRALATTTRFSASVRKLLEPFGTSFARVPPPKGYEETERSFLGLAPIGHPAFLFSLGLNRIGKCFLQFRLLPLILKDPAIRAEVKERCHEDPDDILWHQFWNDGVMPERYSRSDAGSGPLETAMYRAGEQLGFPREELDVLLNHIYLGPEPAYSLPLTKPEDMLRQLGEPMGARWGKYRPVLGKMIRVFQAPY